MARRFLLVILAVLAFSAAQIGVQGGDRPVFAQQGVGIIAQTPAATASNLFNEGLSLHQERTGQALRAAIAKWEQALPLWEQAGDREQLALTLYWLSPAYLALGDTEAALASYQRLLQLYRDLGDRHSEATAQVALGRLQAQRGQYQTALDHYEQALPLWQAAASRTGTAATLNNLGRLYAQLGDLDRALSYYRRALAIAEQAGSVEGQGAALNNIGQIFAAQGDRPRARAHYQQALERWQALHQARPQASTLNNLGYLYAEAGERRKAESYYRQALALWQQAGDRGGEASTLSNLGVLAAAAGELAAAQDLYQQALVLRQAVGDRAKEALTRYHLARGLRQQGDRAQALTEISTAVAIAEELRTNVDDPDLRASFFASQQDYYEFYIDLLMELHQQQPGAGYAAQALQVSEQARARSLLDLLNEAQADIRTGVDPALLQREQTLKAQLDAAEARKIRTLSTPHSPAQAEAVTQELAILLADYRDVQADIRATSPRYAALTQPQPLTLAQIQAQVVADGSLLLEYFVGQARSYLWAVGPQSLTSYVLPGRPALQASVLTLRRELTRRSDRLSPGFRRAVQQLSDQLLGPVADQLRGQRLIVVSDDALNYIPFNSLALPPGARAPQANLLTVPGQPGDRQYIPLIAAHEISTQPSASVLALLRRETAQHSPAPKALAVLADPIFSVNDERLSGQPQRVSLPPDLERSARESGVLFDRIPFTRQEAERILALVDAAQSLQAFGSEANRELAMSPRLSQYRQLHFATHGFLNSRSPELSGLAFSLVDDQGQPQNGFLRLHDIFNLDLRAELVVLSACQTGLGEQVRGEGVVGLTRGFLYAGAKRVVVSLWNVDDEGTAILMSRFYEAMLKDGQEPATALRTAQLSLWAQPEWQAPYYWAAFTLQGEW